MSKRLFGQYYYSMEDSYPTKDGASRRAKYFREKGYFARIAKTGWDPGDKWAVYIRRK